MSEPAPDSAQRPSPWAAAWRRLKEHPLARVGPGLITGVADDDPSGIATDSQAGRAVRAEHAVDDAVVPFLLMAAVQSMCGRIGRVTGKGLAANIKTAFLAPVLRVVVLLLLIANTLNIAADVAAMGEVSELVTGLDRHLMTILLGLISLTLQVFVPYHRYVSLLKWLTLSLLAYAAVLFVVHVPWSQVPLRLVWPSLKLNAGTAAMVTAIFGTTISPYLFFWQASEEVEDMQRQGRRSRCSTSGGGSEAKSELRRIRWDTWSGMFYSDVTAFFIILGHGASR